MRGRILLLGMTLWIMVGTAPGSAQKKPLDQAAVLEGLQHHPDLRSVYATYTHIQTLSEYTYQTEPPPELKPPPPEDE